MSRHLFSDDLLPAYRPTRRSSQLAGAAFVLTAAVAWLAAGYDLGELRTLAAIRDGATLEPSELQAHGTAGRLLAFAQLACAALVLAAFAPWLHQMRCNLRALGVRRLRWRREWAYLGLLVPGLNALRPYQVASEVWRGSDPGSLDPVAWQERPTPLLVSAWWGALLAWVALEILSGLLLYLATGLERIQLAHGLALAADVCAAGSASAGYVLVTRVQRAQEAKWRATGRAGEEAAVTCAGGELPA